MLIIVHQMNMREDIPKELISLDKTEFEKLNFHVKLRWGFMNKENTIQSFF